MGLEGRGEKGMRIYNQGLTSGLNGWLVNAVLIGAGVLFAAWTVNIWLSPGPSPMTQGVRHETRTARPARLVRPGASSYSIVASKDIFSASRTSGAGGTTSRKRLPGSTLVKAPDLTLLGTVILDDGRAAIISARGMEKEARTYKKGDRIGGIVIKEINSDYVTLDSGGQILRVPMSKPAASGASKRPARRFLPQR